MIALVQAAALTSLVAAASSCKDEQPDACRESINRSRSQLSVPDVAAARNSADEAKKQCSTEQQGELSALQREIDAAEAKQREAKAKEQAALAPKPAATSLVPTFVEAVKSYQAEKDRDRCDEKTCKGSRSVGELSATVATAKGQAKAFSVALTFPTELVGCGRFGANRRKHAWRNGGREKEHCIIREGTLKGMAVLVEQQATPPSTDVTVFTDPWVGHDDQLKAELLEGNPPKR